jgi:hypothetical protein
MFLSDNHIAFNTMERIAFEFKYILEAFPPEEVGSILQDASILFPERWVSQNRVILNGLNSGMHPFIVFGRTLLFFFVQSVQKTHYLRIVNIEV